MHGCPLQAALPFGAARAPQPGSSPAAGVPLSAGRQGPLEPEAVLGGVPGEAEVEEEELEILADPTAPTPGTAERKVRVGLTGCEGGAHGV